MVPAKPLPTRRAGHVDDLADGEHVDFQFGAGRERLALALVQAEFLGSAAGGDIRLGEVTGQRLGHARRRGALPMVT